MSPSKRDELEKCCLNCSFLAKSTVDNRPMWVTPEDRKRLKGHEDLKIKTPYFLACAHQVWDEANPFLLDFDEVFKLLTIDRGESCFFYPFAYGLYFPAAEILERRVADRREAERDRALTRRAFWVAFAALIVSILAAIANLAWNVWTHYHRP